MKKLLIISPHFPPINGADMHRVRQSLPYYREFGWEPTVVAVHPDYVEGAQDPLLEKSLPEGLRVIRVKAFSTKYTRKLGLGSLALRSLFFYWRAVNRLLKKERFDLVFFSTTQFPVLVLGNYWKRCFGVPYVIDMQDPWHTDYYLSKPKSERPPKYWFAYRLNKWLEPIAMSKVDAIISVTDAYTKDLQSRYSNINPKDCHTIPFGSFSIDFEIAEQSASQSFFSIDGKFINLVYTGVCNSEMAPVIKALLLGFKMGLKEYPVFSRVRFFFIGTNYAPKELQKSYILPIAETLGLSGYIKEVMDRVSYFAALKAQKDADILLLIGTKDGNYTPSKVYNYIASQKPIFSIFHENSNVNSILQSVAFPPSVTFKNDLESPEFIQTVFNELKLLLAKLPFVPDTNWEAFRPFTARERAKLQVGVFNQY